MATFAKDCLAGKAILITGGLGAIGQVVVGRLLGHSASVTVNDIVEEGRAQQIIRERAWSSDHLAYARADVTRPEEVEGLVSRALGAFGRLDIALCHAGMAFSSPILDYSESDWQKIMDVNLKSAFLVAPDITPYNVTKSGMKMLMRGMARELAAKGIRVNSVAPGIVAVGMAKRQWDTEPDYRRRAQKAIPLGYMQPPESVADALIFLSSDGSDYITGTTLLVDGGCSLYPMD